MSGFKCIGCGLCCKSVEATINYHKKYYEEGHYLRNAVEEFPFKAKDDGSCEKLDENGNCTVYDDRPKMCRVDQMWEEHYQHVDEIPQNEYNLKTKKACIRLQRSAGWRQDRIDREWAD